MTIKAIETRYKGYRFRSRLEARWAVFFDALRLEWEYEKQGYTLGGTPYLPDFWLPGLFCWVEVKPDTPSREEVRLCESLGEQLDRPVAIFSGTPGDRPAMVFCGDMSDSSGGQLWWDDCWLAVTHEGRIAFNSGCHSRCFFLPSLAEVWEGMVGPQDCESRHPQIMTAYERARSARFEHGETLR